MPLTSRGYPYPAPADAANVPAYLQALAAAVDTDQSNCAPLGITSFGDWQNLANVANLAMVGDNWIAMTANSAITVAFRVQQPLTPTKFCWWCTFQAGNYDVGIVNFNTRARLWSLGSTACPATGPVVNVIAGGPTLVPGVDYGMTISASAAMTVRAVELQDASYAYRYDGTSGLVYSTPAFPIPNPLPAYNDEVGFPALALRA